MPSSITRPRAGPQAQQRQRHADVVVEVALRGKGRVALPGAQDGRHHLRHRGLAVAARHAISGRLNWARHAAAKRAQRSQAVGHLDAGQPGSFDATMARRPRHRCIAGVGQEGIGIKALALERHKQVARLQVRVSVCTRATGVAPSPTRRAWGMRWRIQVQRLLQGHHAHVLASPGGAALPRLRHVVENGRRTPAVSW
jgi:hypothetical protein